MAGNKRGGTKREKVNETGGRKPREKLSDVYKTTLLEQVVTIHRAIIYYIIQGYC